jgi:hypothetical protein
MSSQGPIVVVSSGAPAAALVMALSEAKSFPTIECSWSDAAGAVERLQPEAVIVASGDSDPGFAPLANQIAATKPYMPLIVVDPQIALPGNAMPFSAVDGNFDRLSARLRAALRVRTLHATVLRRLCNDTTTRLPDTDPALDATVLLVGRGAAYPALSVALGERLGVVGALSIEAAAKHLSTRDIDGIVLGGGFSPRVVDAFLTVLMEDARFRNLPIVVAVPGTSAAYDLANLEFSFGEPARVVADALPLIRQHAFDQRLSRMLKSIDAGGLLDPRTGLLTETAFNRDFATAVKQTEAHGGGLTVARISFNRPDRRVQFDAARIVSRLMRQMDFGTLQDDGTIVVAFTEADLRNAQMIAKRLSAVIKQTSYGAKREARIEPEVTVASLLPNDSAVSLLARLAPDVRCAAVS